MLKARAHPDFWHCFNRLPEEVQNQARRRYSLWERDPRHRSLHFKKIRDDLWSVRVSRDYRALAVKDDAGWIWFWIGPHTEYDKILAGK